MIDTNNIIASKPITPVQEVIPPMNSEKISTEVRQQSQISSEQIQVEKTKQKSTQIDSKMTEQLVHQLNEELKIFNTKLSFSIDDKTKKTVVKIIDESNNEVIRQIPPEYLLKISQRISELLGLIVDEKF
jgi:flagellar protein FlaG